MTVRTSLAMTVFAFAFAASAPHVSAQNNPIGGLVGGAVGTAGAVVEGAGRVATGTISAATGVALGSKLEPRAGGFYWYNGHCYRRSDDGSYHTVATARCG